MKFVFILIAIFLLSTMLLIENKIFAQENKLTNSNLTISVGENSSQITYDLNYSSYTSKQIIEKISFKFPYKDLENLIIQSNGNALPFELHEEGDVKIVNILLNQAQSSFQFSPAIKLSFTTNEIITTNALGKYLYIPYFVSDFNTQELNYEIKYPLNFNKPDEVYVNNYTLSGNIIFGTTKGSILAFWKDFSSFSGEALPLTNSQPENFLYNLPSEELYSIKFSKNPGFEYGLIDSMENRYALVKSPSDLSIKFYATINQINTNNFIPNIFPPVGLEESLQYMREIPVDLNNIDKLKSLNDYVVKKLSPLLIEETDISLLASLEDRIQSNSKLTSFEYCYLLSSLTSSIKIQSRIVYGYYLFQNDSSKSTPHIWCEFNVDSQIYAADPWIEDIFKIEVLGRKYNDRVKYGNWNPDNSENNILGITDINSDNLLITFKKADFAESQEDNKFNIEYPGTLNSGELNDLTLHFQGHSQFEEIKSIKINGIALDLAKNQYRLALAPNSNNKIKLSFNPGEYAIYLPSYQFQSNIETNLKNYGNTEYTNINPSRRLGLLVVVISIMLFILLALSLKYQTLKRLLIKPKSKYTG